MVRSAKVVLLVAVVTAGMGASAAVGYAVGQSGGQSGGQDVQRAVGERGPGSGPGAGRAERPGTDKFMGPGRMGPDGMSGWSERDPSQRGADRGRSMPGWSEPDTDPTS